MKTFKSSFISVLIPIQTHQSNSPLSKRKNNQSHHSNKRTKLTVLIPYTLNLKHTKSKNQSNQKTSSNLTPDKSKSLSQHKDSSPTDDDSEKHSNPFESQSPPSTRQTTVSLSRPQSPTTVSLSRPQSSTLARDADFNPNDSLISSDEEYQSDEEPHSNQHQTPAVMAPITFQRFKNYFKVKELTINQTSTDEDNLKELTINQTSTDEDDLNELTIDQTSTNENNLKEITNDQTSTNEDHLKEITNDQTSTNEYNFKELTIEQTSNDEDNPIEIIDENPPNQPIDGTFTKYQTNEPINENLSNQLITQDDSNRQTIEPIDEPLSNQPLDPTCTNHQTDESIDQNLSNQLIAHDHDNPNPSSTDEGSTNPSIVEIQINQSPSNHLTWTSERPIRTSQRGEEFYSSIQINQSILNLSQVINLKHHVPIDLNQFKVSGLDSYSLDSNHNSSQHFFWIESLFERDQKKFFHGIRLQKGRDTFVGQSADEFELVLVDQCFEFELSLVQEIVNIQFIFSDQEMINPLPLKEYHCRYRWLPTNGAFIQLERPISPLLNTISKLQIPHSPSELCRRCTKIPTEIDWIRDPLTNQIVLGPDDRHLSFGFIINGTETYKLWDHVRFIRTSSNSTSSKEEIGQIIEISQIKSNLNPCIDLTEEEYKIPLQKYQELETNLQTKQIKVLVRVYERKAWVGTRNQSSEFDFLDDRRIWITSHEEIVDSLNGIIGKCKIDHFIESQNQFINLNSIKSSKPIVEQFLEIWNSTNHFYCILPTKFQQDQFCSVPNIKPNLIPYLFYRNQILDVEEKIQLKELVKDYDQMKLSHLELFGGIGSFSLGFSEHSLTDEKKTMFIDWSIPACETASINFPKAKVFCADVNEILSLMITGKTRYGKTSIKDLRTGNQIFPDQLPKPGEFDLITAGFPCGSHSTLNVVRKGEDPKNALCGVAISFVEFLKPTYVYFENVRGLLKTQLFDHQSQEILTHAFLRLMCGTMISLDYQLRFGVLQAAQYGTPQQRRRFILTSVKRGYTLPNLPEPTHYFPDNKLQIKLPGQTKITIDFRKKFSRGCLNPITIGDTISDLPLFEYRNPMTIMGDFDQHTRIKLRERSKICPLVNASTHYRNIDKTDWVGFKEFIYRSPKALNNFQLFLRTQRNEIDQVIGNGDVEKVVNWHVTGRFSEKIIEQIWHIPMMEGADYKDLPNELKYKEADPKPNRTKDFSKDFEGNFGRLGLNHLFNTVITKMDPKNQGNTGQVLHPSQYRVLTVLEAQRAQGFPDWFKLSNKAEGIQGLYKQIGNTIPLQITISLGLCLLESREIDWNRNQIQLNQEMNELILLDLIKVWEKFQD